MKKKNSQNKKMCGKSERTKRPQIALNQKQFDALALCFADRPLCQQVGVLLPLLAGTRPDEIAKLAKSNSIR